jgi:hypothetical protein
VRRHRVIDRDRVEVHNAATQVYTSEDAGALKADALKDHLFRAAVTEIEAVSKDLVAANAKKLLKDVDLVVDGFDNSAARGREGVPGRKAGLSPRGSRRRLRGGPVERALRRPGGTPGWRCAITAGAESSSTS